MAYRAQEPPHAVRPHPPRRRHVGRSPLTAPVLLFVAATVTAATHAKIAITLAEQIADELKRPEPDQNMPHLK